MRQHNAALLIVWAKETERGQTLPTGGLFYRPSNRYVGMGESGGETVSLWQTERCMCGVGSKNRFNLDIYQNMEDIKTLFL